MKNIVLNLIAGMFLLSLIFAAGGVALAAANDYGLNATAKEAGIPATITDVPKLIGQVIGVILSFLSVAFLILMLYAGFVWMFARGNEAEVTRAKNIIIAAVTGLIVVVASYAITNFVFTFFK